MSTVSMRKRYIYNGNYIGAKVNFTIMLKESHNKNKCHMCHIFFGNCPTKLVFQYSCLVFWSGFLRLKNGWAFYTEVLVVLFKILVRTGIFFQARQFSNNK